MSDKKAGPEDDVVAGSATLGSLEREIRELKEKMTSMEKIQEEQRKVWNSNFLFVIISMSCLFICSSSLFFLRLKENARSVSLNTLIK